MKIMKVGLLTITNGLSFGNRLQNYATQKALSDLGYDVETLDSRFEKGNNFKRFFKLLILKLLPFSILKKINKTELQRWLTFYLWDKKFIHYSDFSFDPTKKIPLSKLKSYDYFIVGSDQIWNPKFSSNTGFELLSFAEKKKRISLASSIGVNDLSKEYIDMYKEEWLKFKALSVREESAAELIYKITGRNAEVLIDPTLMLSRKEWLQFAKKPEHFNTGGYILEFFLTDVDSTTREKIKLFAEKKSLNILSLDRSYSRFEKISPCEFIYIIANADMVFTDSFHCTVFSLIFGKPLTVYDRFDADKVNSRLHTLLKLVNKSQFWVGKNNFDDIVTQNYNEGSYEIEDIIVEQRNKFNKFITSNITAYD